MQVQDMDQNSFFLDTINHEAIIIGPTPTIITAFLVMESCQNYLDFLLKVILIISSLFLEVEISIVENFLSSLSTLSLKL